MAKKEIIISTDVGFNGIKCIVGERYEDGSILHLTHFHTSSDIFELTTFNQIQNGLKLQNDSIFVQRQEENVLRKYVIGSAAKNLIKASESAASIAQNDPFYATAKAGDEDFGRFTSKSFSILHKAVIYRALTLLSCMDDYSDIITNTEKYNILIAVVLPLSLAESDHYDSCKNAIKGYLGDSTDTSKYKTHLVTEMEAEYNKLADITKSSKVIFLRQALAVGYGEEEASLNEDAKFPMFVVDCGGFTVGLMRIGEEGNIEPGAESNTEYAVKAINENVVKKLDEILKKDNSQTPTPTAEQIEALSRAKESEKWGYFNGEEVKELNLTKMYAEEVKKTCSDLFAHCLKKDGGWIVNCKTILVAGGTGKVYYDMLKEEFSKKFKDRMKVVLAKGEIGGEETGSIFAIAAGAFKLASLTPFDEI